MESQEERTLCDTLDVKKRTQQLERKRDDLDDIQRRIQEHKQSDLNMKRMKFLERNNFDASHFGCSQGSVLYPRMAQVRLTRKKSAEVSTFKQEH